MFDATDEDDCCTKREKKGFRESNRPNDPYFVTIGIIQVEDIIYRFNLLNSGYFDRCQRSIFSFLFLYYGIFTSIILFISWVLLKVNKNQEK